MGSYFSNPKAAEEKQSRKRKQERSVDEELPIRKRIRSTYDYVYRELFSKGEGSDLTVKSMGHVWLLHRIYVKQSPFFCAMLDGGWKESQSDVIELELSDTNITKQSLDVIFGSFYRDCLVLSEKTVLSILAAATWFLMEEIRSLCSEFMQKRTNLRNVVEYFQTAKQYNLPDLVKKTIQWGSDNLLLLQESSETFELLRKISVEFMCEVIQRPDLVVVQMEHDVLILLLKWVYLLENPEIEYNSESPSILKPAYKFFKSKGSSFLETNDGKMYAPVFRCIRWEHLVNEHKVTQQLLSAHIIPECWLSSVFSRQWLRVLQTHYFQVRATRRSSLTTHPSNSDSYGLISGSGSTGHNNPSRFRATLSSRASPLTASNESLEGATEPGPPEDLSDEVFWATSERCGRHMANGDTTCSWRWTGFNFGVDIVIKYKRRTFSVIRFTETAWAEGAISHVPRIRLMIAMRVRSLVPAEQNNSNTANGDEQIDPETQLIDVVHDAVYRSSNSTSSGAEECTISTNGILSLTLEQNVVQDVLRLPDNFRFPAVVSANILRYDPLDGDSAAAATETLSSN